MHDFFAKLSTSSALKDSNFEFGSDFGCSRDCSSKFDKFSKEITFESSDTEITDIFVSIIKTAFVIFFGLVFLFTLGICNIFLELDHELSEGFVDDGLEFVVFSEDQAGEFVIMME